MQGFVFIGAGAWSVIYSAFIATVLSANYTPVVNRGVDVAVMTAANVIGYTAMAAFIHVLFQIALDRYRPINESRGEKIWDGVTTFLPILVVGFVTWHMSGKTPNVAWWPTLYSWVWWIVAASVVVDLYNAWKGVKIWSGRVPAAHVAPAAHPPAAHPPAGGPAHP